MPQLRALDLDELDAKQLLVDLEDRGDDLAHGEVLFDLLIVELKLALEQAALVVPEVVHVELAVEWVSLRGVLFLFEREQRRPFARTDRAQFLLEVVEELWASRY